jgi:nucleotide-binding universal stress UspA family protein
MFDLANIVAPLDYSSTSRFALAVADYLARVYGAGVQSIHVVPKVLRVFERVLFPYAAMGEDLPEFEVELVDQAGRDLRQHLGGDENNSAAPPQRVICADVHQGVLDETVRVGPDLVVMGAHGESRPRARHIGSTASFLADAWPGRLLLVRELGTRERPFQRIVAATDFAAGAELLILSAVGLALRTQSPLTLVTVVEDPRLRDSAGLVRASVRDVDSWPAKGKKNRQRQVERVFSTLNVPFPYKAQLDALKPEMVTLFGDPGEEIVQLLSQIEAPLLMVGRSQRDRSRGAGDWGALPSTWCAAARMRWSPTATPTKLVASTPRQRTLISDLRGGQEPST